MKKSIVLLALASAASALMLAADDTSLSGKWQVHSSIAGNDNDQSCMFTQKDADLTGSCTSADKANVTITGKVNGKKITWSYKSEYNGSPLTVQFEGTLGSGREIKGTVNVPEYSADGDFTATESK